LEAITARTVRDVLLCLPDERAEDRSMTLQLALADYQEAVQRLRDAQRAYDANRDDRASDERVRDAIRALLVARADIENIRRRARRAGWEIDY
jgi:hypothetical protein